MAYLNTPECDGNTLSVWGEPTVCEIAVCDTPFIKDGSVRGNIERHYGGSTYATAINMARKGTQVCFAGPFGEDSEGLGALEFMRDHGVLVEPIPAGVSRRTIIIVDTDGSRSMVGNVGHAFLKPYAETIEKLEGDIVHVSLSSVVRDKTRSVENLLVRSEPAILSLDAGSVEALETLGSERIQNICKRARYTMMFANEEESSCIENNITNHKVDCFIRRTKEGAFLYAQNKEWFEPAERDVQVVDTTGAGDAFSAGFLTALLAGERDPNKLLRAGHKLAAEVIARVGTL